MTLPARTATSAPPEPASAGSFTGAGSLRYPAPDVARGFMLLLIALANVSHWLSYLPAPAGPSAVDRMVEVVRACLIETRAYPLFAMLFGFGIMTMASRRIEADVREAAERVDREPALSAVLADPVARARWERAVRVDVMADARRLVRRRGLWMILFGAVHGVIFTGDVIGAYGLIAVLLAGVLVYRRKIWMIVVGGATALIGLWSAAAVGSILESAGGSGADGLGGEGARLTFSAWYPLSSLARWPVSTVVFAFTSYAVVCVLIGARLADSDLLSHPDRHRGRLLGGGVAGILVGVVGAVPYLLLTHGSLPPHLGGAAVVVSSLSGVAGAFGWLCLLAAWAGPGRPGPLRGARWVLAAVGKRSMTAYVGQSVLFLAIVGSLVLMHVGPVGEAAGELIAVLVWAAVAAFCVVLERAGRARGPLEVLLRRAVAATARRRPPLGAGALSSRGAAVRGGEASGQGGHDDVGQLLGAGGV